MEISIIQPSRNNLKYLKWSYESIRKNQGHHTVQICIADDASSDGTKEWLESQALVDPHLSFIINESGHRLGHTILYDKLVNEVAKYELCMIFHADMYLCPGALDAIESEMYAPYPTPMLDANTNKQMRNVPISKLIVSLTRIEPPLHPPGPEKILVNFGVEPEEFDESKFLEWFKDYRSAYYGPATTKGVFAPWAFWKSEFQEIGGHDPIFAPQSKEDSFVGETLIFIIDNLYKRIVRVSDLWKQYASEVVIRPDGKRTIDLRKYNIKVLSPLNDGKIGIRKLNGIIQHTTTWDNIITVRGRSGIVKVTKDHSLINYNLNEVTARQLLDGDGTLWEPCVILDWCRRNLLSSLIIEPTESTPTTKRNDFKFPEIHNIDVNGGTIELLKLCEFLGFFVAEGSTYMDTIKICGNDYDELAYYANIFCELFNAPMVKCMTSKKVNNKDVYSYSWGSKHLSSIFKEMLGGSAETKKVPDFIFNIPKVYQKSFLYGYLRGDGYLGTTLKFTGYNTKSSISVDKRLYFKKNSLAHYTWKSTSKSDILTTGLYYLLLRCNPESTFRVSYNAERQVYNLASCTYEKTYPIDIIQDVGTGQCTVYDLEVADTNKFVGGVGMIGLHNSDIFNRFKLHDNEFKQTWSGYVYHMTCRGSRFNPTLTTPGKNSDEWEQQNVRSTRNFIRKWGTMVKHDEHMNPIISPRYHKTIVLTNATIEAVAYIEPFCDLLLTDLPQYYLDQYIAGEQPNTMLALSSKIKFNTDPDIFDTDVIIYIDMNESPDLGLLNHIPELLATAELGELYAVRGLKLKISKRNDLSHLLIKRG